MTDRDDKPVTAMELLDLMEPASPLPRGAGLTAWRMIADDIEAAIRAGEFAPLARLPTEAQLANRFAVNRHTVRRAIAELAAKGLVRATQGRGTFVERPPIAYPIGPRTRFTEVVSREGRSPGGELVDAGEEPASPDVAALLRIAEGVPVAWMRIRRLIDGVPVSLAVSRFPLPRFAGLAEAFRRTGSITSALAASGVEDYRRAETRISARIAGLAEAAALDLAPGRVLVAITAVNVDRDGTPIQATHGLFPADRMELVIES